MVKKSRGILKNGPKYHEEDASSENLLFSSDPFNVAHIATTTDPTMPALERSEKSEKRADDEGVFVDVGLANESDYESTHEHEQRPAVHKVQFPDSISKAAPYARQDTDMMSTRSGASSVYGGDEDDSEDYDWSDEEDLVDEQAKFNKKLSSKKENRPWGPTRIISLLFSSLVGSVFLAGIIITPALLVHFYWYKPHPTEFRTYVKDNIEAWLFWTAANLVISWGLAMIIDLLPVVFRYFIAAIWGHVSESVKARLEVYESVKGTIKPAFYAGSAYASWTIIFQHIYKLFDAGDNTNSRAQYTNRLAQVVEFFFFLIFVWRLQAMVAHFIAFAFHQVAYKERVAEVENSLVVIEKLRQYKPKNQFRHTPNKSGIRTPTFGWIAPLSNTQHYNLLHSALQETSKGEAETLAGTRTKKHERGASFEPPSPNRLSWQNSYEAGSRSGHGHKRAQSSYNLNEPDTEVAAAHELDDGVAVELEVLPSEPAVGQVFTAAPAVPSHLNPHRYPPNTDTRPSSHTSSDDIGYHPYGSPGGVAGAATAAAGAVDATIRQTAKALKAAVLHDARNIKGNADERGGLGWNIHSAREAKRLARSIFTRFRDRGRSWLIAADFYPAFPDHASAEAAFKVFDKDSNGDISRAEIKTALLKIYKERRFLSRSMRDVGEALQTLDRILLCVAIVIMFFIALSVFGVEVGDSLTSVYTLGIAASFIFKASASSAFDAIMFLFVTHPYDTGDRVLINDQNMVVKKVGLFATVFLRADGTETYYFNSQLFTQFILNMRRSGKTFENLTMQVAWTTPLTKLDALERSLNDWLSTEENRWFEPSTNIVLQNIAFQRYLEITIGIGHNGNWQDWGLHNVRRTAFHAAAHYYCRELGIVGYEATIPIVYADPVTHTYSPEAAADVFSPQPASPTPSVSRRDAEETERQAKEMKPMLGFLPPIHDRSSHLTRARKSRNRKANLGAGNG